MRLTLAVLSLGALTVALSHAQQIVSAHAGVVHYTEGRVFVGDQLVERKFGVFPDLQVGQELRTEDGRAEVLLTPGAFLRISENSSVRMLSRDISDTRFEVLNGSAMVECDELPKNTSLTLVYQGHDIELEKHGLYRLDTAPGRFQVYDGRAVVHSGSDELTLKRGKETRLDGVLQAEKFNLKQTDGFYSWNGTRSGYIASANVSAAYSLYSNRTSWHSSSWMWDPWYGAFTFVPAGGVIYNPFGWGFWSPAYVMYAPVPYYGGYGSGGGIQNARNTPGVAAPAAGTGVSRNSGGSPPAGGMRPGGFGGGPSAGVGGGMPRSGGGFGGGGMAAGGGGMRGGGGMATGSAGHAGGGASSGHGR